MKLDKRKLDKETRKFLKTQSPTYHVELLTLFKTTSGWEDVKDDETIEFDYPDSLKYSIRLDLLKELADKEMEELVKNNKKIDDELKDDN